MKVYVTDEERVIETAQIFAKNVLECENDLPKNTIEGGLNVMSQSLSHCAHVCKKREGGM